MSKTNRPFTIAPSNPQASGSFDDFKKYEFFDLDDIFSGEMRMHRIALKLEVKTRKT